MLHFERTTLIRDHCVKSVQIRSCFWSRNNYAFGHFHTVDNKKKRYMRRVKLFIEESWDSHLKLLIGTSESSCYSSLLTKALADTDFAFS